MKNKKSVAIVRDVAFCFTDVESARDAMTGKSTGDVYGRWAHGNPTVRAAEEEIAYLEFRNLKKPEDISYKNCLLYSSGMAAISQLFFGLNASGFLKPGDEVICTKPLYMTTIDVMKKDLALFGIKVKFVDGSSWHNVKNTITSRTKVIFAEFLANPTLVETHVEAIARWIKGMNILFVVDNSLGSPYYYRPLEHGAHLVVHSVTKFISGHGDVIAGAIIGEEEHMSLFIDQYHRFGGCLSPDVASLIHRSCKTFDVRLERQGKNARELAGWLKAERRIKKVHYPEFVDEQRASFTHSQMRTPSGEEGFGAMVSIEMHTAEDSIRLLNTLASKSTFFNISVSLGFTQTRGEFDAGMVHAAVASEEEMREFGLSPTLIRLTIGLEDVDGVIADFAKALQSIS